MRSPSIHTFAGIDNKSGLSNRLASQAQENSIRRFEAFNIDVLPAGPSPPNAAELLAGDSLGQFIREMKTLYDHVVMDSPPVLGLADAVLIGNHANATIYVIEAGGMRAPPILAAVRRLQQSRVRVIGAVLTKFDPRNVEHDYAYSYGGYGYGYGQNHAA